MTQHATIADVARVAGVSPATVSRALRGEPKVTEETRARVLVAAEQLEYLARPLASALASGNTGTIGVVTAFVSRWFFAHTLGSMERTARQAGKHVMLLSLEDEGLARRKQLTRSMVLHRVDALVVVNVPLTPNECEVIDRLAMPAITIGTPLANWPRVGIDDVDSTRTPTEHLIDLGHRRIAYLGAPVLGDDHQFTPSQREAGYRAAMAHAGLRVPEGYVLPCDWAARGARRQIGPLLDLPADRRPTAVVTGSDEMAFGVMGAAAERGLRVPEDLSVTGVDDHELAEVFGLTTMAQDVPAQGIAAIEVANAMIRGTDPNPTPEEHPIRFVPRRSSGPPAT